MWVTLSALTNCSPTINSTTTAMLITVLSILVSFRTLFGITVGTILHWIHLKISKHKMNLNSHSFQARSHRFQTKNQHSIPSRNTTDSVKRKFRLLCLYRRVSMILFSWKQKLQGYRKNLNRLIPHNRENLKTAALICPWWACNHNKMKGSRIFSKSRILLISQLNLKMFDGERKREQSQNSKTKIHTLMQDSVRMQIFP